MSSHLIRQDLLPVGVGYALVMSVLAGGLWAARRRVASGRSLTRHTGRRFNRGWPALLWHVCTDALGGYLLLAAVVVLYYYLVAKVASNFLESEFTGSAVLLAVALPVYLGATWLREWRAARRDNSSEENGNGQPGA